MPLLLGCSGLIALAHRERRGVGGAQAVRRRVHPAARRSLPVRQVEPAVDGAVAAGGGVEEQRLGHAREFGRSGHRRHTSTRGTPPFGAAAVEQGLVCVCCANCPFLVVRHPHRIALGPPLPPCRLAAIGPRFIDPFGKIAPPSSFVPLPLPLPLPLLGAIQSLFWRTKQSNISPRSQKKPRMCHRRPGLQTSRGLVDRTCLMATPAWPTPIRELLRKLNSSRPPFEYFELEN